MASVGGCSVGSAWMSMEWTDHVQHVEEGGHVIIRGREVSLSQSWTWKYEQETALGRPITAMSSVEQLVA